MIDPGDIQEELDKKPFVPFDICMSDGSRHTVTAPEFLALMERTAYLALPKKGWKSFSYEGIIYLEGVGDD